MIQHFLKSRRILTLLLAAVLVMAQTGVAFAACVSPDASITTSIMTMDDCQGCSSAANSADRYDVLSNISGNHYLRSYVPPAQGPELLAIATVALVNAEATAPLRNSPQIQAAFPGKSHLLYRIQRLLI